MREQIFSAFKKTNTTYNYFWFLSVLEFVQKGKYEIEKRELFAQMLTLAAPWTQTSFSFKKQDQIPKLIEKIKKEKKIKDHWGNTTSRYQLFLEVESELYKKEIWQLDQNAPHRFLSPWLLKQEKETFTKYKTRIMEVSQNRKNHLPYALLSDKIIIHPEWFDFFVKQNSRLKVETIAKLIAFLDQKSEFKFKI